MFIEPIQYGSIISDGLGTKKTPEVKPTEPFADVFKNAWNAAETTQQDLVEKQYLQSIGEIEDTHTVPIAMSKAELSLNLLVSIRNKALESYNELIRVNV